MVKAIVDGGKLVLIVYDDLTENSVNQHVVEFEFSEEWTNLSKTLICKNGDLKMMQPVVDNSAVIPRELLQCGGNLEVAVQGVGGDNSRFTTNVKTLAIKDTLIVGVSDDQSTLEWWEQYYIKVEESVANAKVSEENAKTSETNTKNSEENVQQIANTFETNAQTKTNEYNDNAENKLNIYNRNHIDKLEIYNENDVVKVNVYNQNHADKLAEYNDNADNANIVIDEKVETATEQAERAQTAAQAAISNLTTIENSIDTAIANAETATAAATTAKNATNTAITNAENATTAANTAKNEAEAATTAANTAKANADTATTAANTAATAATTAKNNADTATTAANTATTAANTAISNAEAATAAANTATQATNTAISNAEEVTTTAQNLIDSINEKTIKKYGVRRAVGQTSATLERVWDGVGLTAQAGIDDTEVTNDFDNIYPFSHIRECNISIIGGEIVVNAYKGEPTFATDGTNGEVAIEIPLFYEAPKLPGDGYEYWGVSEFNLGGWEINPDFIGSNGQILSKIYYSKYNASVINIDDVDTIVSRSGLPPEVQRSRTSFRSLATAVGANLISLPFHDILSTLFTVEFATLNSQSIMSGATSLPWTTTHRPVIAETETNRVVLANSYADTYCIGCTIDIGTSQGGRQIAKNRKITEITEYDTDNKSITFDGEAVETTTTQYVYAVGWFTGSTDSVVASSGSIISNTSGKYPCKYRGIENPWGNVWQWLDGVNIQNYQAWICTDPAEYQDDKFEAPYKQLNYINASTNGYVKKTGLDDRYPWARLPIEIGGGSTTYFSDYYYQSTGNRALLFGGGWYTGTSAGLWCFLAHNPASHVSVSYGSRLSWKP